MNVVKKNFKRKRVIDFFKNFVFLIIFLWFAYITFYELFVFKYGVHYPRITINKISLSNFNTPTITAFIVLLSALISICASIMIFIILLKNLNKKTKKYRIIQIIGFIVCLLSMTISWFDFLRNAFQGVG